jgi:SAM-dependent methyltransferase|tara:strand:+ start:3727 stop:4380 length:654 start_codon:yes stop_codon:yes gene_type:complete
MAATKQEQYLDKISRDGAIKFVGSQNKIDFYLMGKEHFNYLKYHGLKPDHVFFDVGCGALRTGQHIIPYLDSDNYFGLDRMPELIEYGLNEVLTPEIVFERNPKFSVNNIFNCTFVDKPVNFAWCQSLMSHLGIADIKQCLRNVKETLAPNGRIYFTYFQLEGLDEELANNQTTHSKEDLFYSEQHMNKIVASCGLTPLFNGPVGHPRGQWMYICKA